MSTQGFGYVSEGRVNVGAFIEPSLKRQLVEIAYSQEKSLSDVIRDAFREYVAARASEPKARRAT